MSKQKLDEDKQTQWRKQITKTTETLLDTIKTEDRTVDTNQSTLVENTTTDSNIYTQGRKALIDDLHTLVEYAISFSEMSWNPDDVCPSCGHDEHVRIVEETNAIVNYEDGSSKSKGAHPNKTTYGYQCMYCEEYIKLSPKGFLLDISADLHVDIPALREALNVYASPEGKLQSDEWEGGDTCLSENCNRRDTQQADVYAAYGGGAEFVDIVSIHCKSCLEPLELWPADGLPDVYSFSG